LWWAPCHSNGTKLSANRISPGTGIDLSHALLRFDSRDIAVARSTLSGEERLQMTRIADDRFMTVIWTYRDESIRIIPAPKVRIAQEPQSMKRKLGSREGKTGGMGRGPMRPRRKRWKPRSISSRRPRVSDADELRAAELHAGQDRLALVIALETPATVKKVKQDAQG